jgi:hypothetical protein
VPVIVGMYDETAAYATKPADDFFKRLSETNGTPGKPFYMPNGTPFFCTASGILLKNGLADWDKLPQTERKPGAVAVPKYAADPELAKKNRRLTKPPANVLILRSYIRGLKPEADGRLRGPKVIPQFYNIPAEPNRDFVWLLEGEWKSLMPAEPAKGQSFPVPDAVRDRICLWHIAGGYHCLPGYYTPDRFQSREMTLTVEDATAREVTLRLTGAAAIKGGATYQFHGLLRYNPEKKTFNRFDVMALCDEGHEPKSIPQNVAPFRHYGIAFELPGDRTDDLLPPFYLRENGGTPERYFANSAR